MAENFTPDFNPKDPNLKRMIISKSGRTGGMLVGYNHGENPDNGIRGVNVATNQDIRTEGGEVIITAPAVEDPTLREFEGEQLTNRQILDRINVGGGGVSFADKGMEVPKTIKCADCSYQYGGQTLTSREIAENISLSGIVSYLDKKAKELCYNLECDGTTKILSKSLDDTGINHKIFLGTIEHIKNGRVKDSFFPHQWIYMEINRKPFIVDYKARMWMGKNAPDGVIAVDDLKEYRYKGQELFINPKVKELMYKIQTAMP